MLILAIDTTSADGGVALFRDGECLALIRNAESSGYSVTLFQALDRALAEAGTKLSTTAMALHDIDLFAAATGPGSFTGIRTGLAATQGWATALCRPVVGVSILEAMVHQATFHTEWAAAIMDARREEFYAALYRRNAGGGRPISQSGDAGVVLSREALAEMLQAQLGPPESVGGITCLTREHDLAAARLAGHSQFLQKLRWQCVPDCQLESIARIALAAHRTGKIQAPAELDAYYLRRADAEINWRA